MLQASERGVVADLAADGDVLENPDVAAAVAAVAAVRVLPIPERIAASILEQFAGVVLRVAEAASKREMRDAL